MTKPRLAAADVGLLFRHNGDKDEADDTFNGTLIQRSDLCRLQVVKNRLEGQSSIYLRMIGDDRFEPASHAEWKAGYTGSDNRPKVKRIEDELMTLLAAGDWMPRQDIVDAMAHDSYGENNTDKALKALVNSGALESTRESRTLKYRLKIMSGEAS